MSTIISKIRISRQEKQVKKFQDWLSENELSATKDMEPLLTDISKYLDQLYPGVPMPEDVPSTNEGCGIRACYDEDEPDEEVSSSVLMEPSEASIRYSLGDGERHYHAADATEMIPQRIEDYKAEEERKERIKALKADLIRQINALRDCGADEQTIRTLVEKALTPACSPLHISADYRLTIPQLGNIEINLFPADKALYLTFLCYPEGIYFNHLVDYREEMMDFYLKISKRKNPEAAEDVINRLTDQCGNGINTSVSRINKAFTTACGSLLARNYCILGGKGERKKVYLRKGMVVWEKTEMR